MITPPRPGKGDINVGGVNLHLVTTSAGSMGGLYLKRIYCPSSTLREKVARGPQNRRE